MAVENVPDDLNLSQAATQLFDFQLGFQNTGEDLHDVVVSKVVPCKYYDINELGDFCSKANINI